jgi:hypothetical protein|tara:strand:- start:159 stop:947 length:789 start_codon:yes stop_codon:yes gene_type:complete
MAFNKIQPEQIQLATFFSNSGDIAINQTDTGVRLNLSREITGDFAFTGDANQPFKVNGKQVLTASHSTDSNFTFESGSFSINGTNNSLISGIDNVAINANGISVSGTASENISLNGAAQVFGSGVENCFAVGQQATFSTPTTGSVIFSDFQANATETKGNDSFVVDYTSGSYFEGGDTYHLNNVVVASSKSGLFSGDLNVLGDTFLSGVGVSGIMTFNTGFTLPQYIGSTMQGTSGAMAVSGDKVAIFLTGGWVALATGGSL